jgi:hypothetical protein
MKSISVTKLDEMVFEVEDFGIKAISFFGVCFQVHLINCTHEKDVKTAICVSTHYQRNRRKPIKKKIHFE